MTYDRECVWGSRERHHGGQRVEDRDVIGRRQPLRTDDEALVHAQHQLVCHRNLHFGPCVVHLCPPPPQPPHHELMSSHCMILAHGGALCAA